jgi:tRNA wybutosine-synthesizing protein 3
MSLSKNDLSWGELRERYLSSLLEERLVAYLDPGAEPVLRILNSMTSVVTTSSCVGRITVVEAKYPWERRECSRIIFKKHSEVSVGEIALLMARPFSDMWLKVSGPIIHMRVRSLKCASALLDLARRSGFKHSGIISLDERGPSCCTLELNSPTQLIAPLRVDGVTLVRGAELRELVSVANRILREGRRRLSALIAEVETGLRACGSQNYLSEGRRPLCACFS